MERKRGEGQGDDYADLHQWFNTTSLSENQMYWDRNLFYQNPLVLQNPSYHQNPNPNFDHLLFPGNNTNNNLLYPGNNTNGFSTLGFNSNNGFPTLGFGTAGGGLHDFAADHTLQYDQLASSFNRLSISNPTSNQRVPSYMPGSTILGNVGFNPQEQNYLEKFNQYAFLMADDEYIRRSNLISTNNGVPHSWNRNSSSRGNSHSIHGNQFGYGYSQMRSTSSSQRNGVSRGSRSANGGGRQRYGQEEKRQGLSLMSTKDQGLGNGSTRQDTPSYYSVTLEELRGKIAFEAREHVGSRFLQKKIEEGKIEEIDMIFNDVMVEGHDFLRELMVDQFGTDFIQKLVEGTNREGWTKMLNLVMSDERRLKDICTDQHGSRAMQKLLERVETREQQSSFMRLLKRITIPLSKTQPGHYVIQVCLKNFSLDCIKGVVELVLDNSLALAKDKFGCCVVQNCMDYGYPEAKERLVADVTEHARVLSEDPYGNYVVQYIIGMRVPRITADLLAQLQHYFVYLSMNKHGSNVVEKSLKEAGEEHANMIIHEVMNSPEFLNVCQSPYGNYVAQSALAVSKGSVHNALVNLIWSYYPHLHSHLYGKRVLEKTKSRHRA